MSAQTVHSQDPDTTKNSHIYNLTHTIQQQIDATVTLAHHLLRDFELILVKANATHADFATILKLEIMQSPESQPELQDRLVVLRAHQRDHLTQLDQLIMTLKSAIDTLRAMDRTADGVDIVHHKTVVQDSFRLTAARRAVDELKEFRDTYLESTIKPFLLFQDEQDKNQFWMEATSLEGLLDAVQSKSQMKSVEMLEKFTKTIKLLREFEPDFANATAHEKANFCYLNGKAMNAILPEDKEDSNSDDSDNLATVEEWNNFDYSASDSLHHQDSRAQSNYPTNQTCNRMVTVAMQWLTRALKFNPLLTEAWCELGECHWRQGDLMTAKQHFEQAVKIDPNNIEALCQLSMLLRHLPAVDPPAAVGRSIMTGSSCSREGGSVTDNKGDSSPPSISTDSNNTLSESLRLAHKAVKCRPSDSHAWLVLGNALLTAFFADPSTPFQLPQKTHQPMTRCLAAYAQAAKHVNILLEPNFHYNRGLAWHYQDMFSQCLISWLRAVCLDPCWSTPRSRAVCLADFLLAVADVHSSSTNCVDEAFVAPLAACIFLRVGDSDGVTGPFDRKRTMSDKQLISALSRILGPFYQSVTGDSDSKILQRTAAGYRRHAKKAEKKRAMVKENNNQASGHETSETGKPTCKLTFFSELHVGSNPGCICVGRVVRRLPADSELAVNLLLVDAHNHPITVRLCNVGKDLGPADKDIIVIPHPYLEERKVDRRLLRAAQLVDRCLSPPAAMTLGASPAARELSGLRITESINPDIPFNPPQSDDTQSDILQLHLIRVPLPNLLTVNGCPVGSKWTAVPVLQNVFFTAA